MSSQIPVSMPPSGIDFKAILVISLRSFVMWLVPVLLITFAANTPGVVCATPMAWLIALQVGWNCVAKTRSMEHSRRVIEAALAGALLGFLQGVLFALIVRTGEIKADEQMNAAVINAIMLVGGVIFGGGMAAAIGARASKLREKSEKTPA